MARTLNKPLVWLRGEVKTPPFSAEARVEAGFLLRRLQKGENLGLPHSRPMPSIGSQCHELRINDENQTWRIVYHACYRRGRDPRCVRQEDCCDTKRSFDELQETPCSLYQRKLRAGKGSENEHLQEGTTATGGVGYWRHGRVPQAQP